MAKRLVIIDGKSVFYRGYYAMPGLSTADGTPTGGVYGFAALSLELIKQLEPDYVCVAWDKRGTNIRRRLAIYPDYKAGRKPAPPDFYAQIPILHELLAAFGWPLYEFDDYEADDIMATLDKQAEQHGGIETYLITSDLDALQILDQNTYLYALKKGLTNIDKFDIPVHMVETINKLLRTQRRMTQELNREPTIEELAKELEMEPEKVEYVMKIKQDISSLDAGVGRDGDDEGESVLGDFIEDEGTISPEESASNQLLKEQVKDLLGTLSDREQKIVRMRFGLDSGKSHTLEEVGQEFAVTRERIRQIEAKALAKLRKHKDAKKLYTYLQ